MVTKASTLLVESPAATESTVSAGLLGRVRGLESDVDMLCQEALRFRSVAGGLQDPLSWRIDAARAPRFAPEDLLHRVRWVQREYAALQSEAATLPDGHAKETALRRLRALQRPG